jgi:hypothetical protein
MTQLFFIKSAKIRRFWTISSVAPFAELDTIATLFPGENMITEKTNASESPVEPAEIFETRSDPVCAGAPVKAPVPAMSAIKAVHSVPPKAEASAQRQPTTSKEKPPLRPAQSSSAMFDAGCMTFLSIAEGGPGFESENKRLKNPIQARPYPVPPEDIFSRLAAVSRSPMNPELTSDTRILCNIADDVIRERGLDSFTESIFKVMLSTVGKQIVLVSVRCDLENNRLGTGSRDEPIARVNRDEYFPLLEQLSGLFMKINRERCSGLHIRNLAAREATAPAAPAQSPFAKPRANPKGKRTDAA